MCVYVSLRACKSMRMNGCMHVGVLLLDAKEKNRPLGETTDGSSCNTSIYLRNSMMKQIHAEISWRGIGVTQIDRLIRESERSFFDRKSFVGDVFASRIMEQ